MNLEQLTKTQVILLTLFVSFVTSIATGIVTVTLMDQAPSDVTRTINRVVEKTVEKVVPGETRIVERIKEISNPTESDLAINAIEETKQVLVYGKTLDGLASRGFFVSKNEAVMLALPGLTKDKEIAIIWVGDNGTTTISIPGKVRKVNAELGLMIVALNSKSAYPAVTFDGAPVPALGQRVISVGYSSRLGVNVDFGNVVGMLDSAGKEGERSFLTSLSGGASHLGAPVVDVSARVIGILSGRSEELGGVVVIPLPRIASFMGEVAGTATSSDSVLTN